MFLWRNCDAFIPVTFVFRLRFGNSIFQNDFNTKSKCSHNLRMDKCCFCKIKFVWCKNIQKWKSYERLYKCCVSNVLEYIFYKKTQRRCNFKHTGTYFNFGKEPLSLQINTLKAIHAHTDRSPSYWYLSLCRCCQVIQSAC